MLANPTVKGHRLTNQELADTHEVFRKACELAGQYPSRNRYRRFKYGRGLPYTKALEAGLLTNAIKAK